jgi:hypothetical protein
MSRQPSLTDYDRSKTNDSVDYFNYLVSLIINDAGYMREIKSRFNMGNAALIKKTTLFTA